MSLILLSTTGKPLTAKLLDDAYRTEHDGDVRERLLLVRRILVDNEQTAGLAENLTYLKSSYQIDS
jgi:hypothetical protein